MQRWFALLSVFHGFAVIGTSVFIFLYYTPITAEQLTHKVRWYIMAIVASYILLTMATVITISLGFYKWGDLWYWLITLAYITGDISLLYVFREAVKKKQ